METPSSPPPALLLTSGASGRVNALFSVRTLKSLVLLIKASLLFLLLLPFQLGLWRTASSSSSSSNAAAGDMKDDKKHQQHQDNRSITSRSPFLFFFFGAGRKIPVSASLVRSNSNSRALVVSPGVTDAVTRRELAIKGVALDDDDKVTNRDFSLFPTSRGDTLFTQSWTPGSTNISYRSGVGEKTVLSFQVSLGRCSSSETKNKCSHDFHSFFFRC